jgi:hypothetical protein
VLYCEKTRRRVGSRDATTPALDVFANVSGEPPNAICILRHAHGLFPSGEHVLPVFLSSILRFLYTRLRPFHDVERWACVPAHFGGLEARWSFLAVARRALVGPCCPLASAGWKCLPSFVCLLHSYFSPPPSPPNCHVTRCCTASCHPPGLDDMSKTCLPIRPAPQ